MAYILNIDTATDICSVALANNATLLAYRENKDGKSHAKTLLPFIADVLQEAKIASHQLEAVAISMGPGSYTGLRIGTSTAKGLCYALNIPLIAIPTLQIIAAGVAHSYSANHQIVPLLDARRMEVFTCIYDSNLQPVTEVTATVVDENTFSPIAQNHLTVFCGNGVEKCTPILRQYQQATLDSTPISARNMTALSAQQFSQQKFENVAYFEPFYLKEYIAAKPHVKGLQ